MTLNPKKQALRQSTNMLLERFDYLTEDEADFSVDLEENTGTIRLFGIREDDLEECQKVMLDGFEDTITLSMNEQSDESYTVTAEYNELP